MKAVKQKTTFPIDNHDFVEGENKQEYKHSPLFPSTLRCIIVGPSNCGKTNLMLNLIEHPNGLKFRNIYIYSKSLYQPKYLYLHELLKPIKEIGYYAFNNDENIIDPSEAKTNSLFIFDDVACDKQDVIRRFFSMGRHKQVDCFYLSQSYAQIGKHLIRENANVIVLFKQDDQNLRHVHKNHIGGDMSFETFQSLCSKCWNKPYGFFGIFKDNRIDEGRYREGFDVFIHLKQ